MVALGDVGPHQVARALLEHERAANAPAATEGQELAVRAPRRKAKAPTSAFTVVGVGNLLVQVARCRSEEHTSELQSLMRISYDVFCLKKTKNITRRHQT